MGCRVVPRVETITYVCVCGLPCVCLQVSQSFLLVFLIKLNLSGATFFVFFCYFYITKWYFIHIFMLMFSIHYCICSTGTYCIPTGYEVVHWVLEIRR